MIPIIKKRKIWFTFSGALVAASIILFIFVGLKPGIDFTGGSLMELEFFIPRPDSQQINDALTPLGLVNVTVQPVGDKEMVLRFKDIDEKTHQEIIQTIKEKFKLTGEINGNNGAEIQAEAKILEEKRFDSIGPTIGQ